HNLALRSQGTVAAWGSNIGGQTNVPVGASNVVALAAGKDGSLALSGTLGPTLSLTHPVCTQGVFTVSAATVRGRSYRLEFKDSVSDMSWKMVTPIPGDGTLKVLTDGTATGPKRFYRVRMF